MLQLHNCQHSSPTPLKLPSAQLHVVRSFSNMSVTTAQNPEREIQSPLKSLLKPLLNEFREQILPERQKGTRNNVPTPFFPVVNGHRDFLSWRFCAALFRVLIPFSQNPPDEVESAVKSYCKKVFGNPGLRVILCVLLWYGDYKDIKRLLMFQENLLEAESTLSDRDLPLDERSAKKLFGESVESAVFLGCQHEFFAGTLCAGKFRQAYHAPTILPWYADEDTRLGEGAYGTVYAVKIARGHFVAEEPETRNADVSEALTELHVRCDDGVAACAKKLNRT